ncbi:hypothetical protein FGIG_04715 [Fasciola gigantica]|uniref:PDZ domain-containing protein n=1 Tax=Fasciola gigantica TaxID=46835 RepID=A0A504YXA7_FASGI|nr:hypothetical protein FGIG_04715 [Fasciola gigantica]
MIVNHMSVEQNMANTTGFVTATVKSTTTPITNTQNPPPSSPASDKPTTKTLTSTNTTTSCASTHTLGRSTFFQRLRWRRGQRGTRSASNSADGSPILTTSELPTRLSNTAASLDTDVGQVPDVATASTACVKLVDTQITKGPNGFGLTIADVVTFIPDKLLGLRSTSGCSSYRLGFYQRLLQIRSVNSSSLPGSPHDRETVKSGSTNHSVRPGDMLLAVEGFRLAGCSPEFAVRLLASVPVGGVVHVTLLRGLALAPMSTRSKPEQFLTDRLHSKYASQETTNNHGHLVGCKSETVSPLLSDETFDSLKKSERKLPFKRESAKRNEKLFDTEIFKQSGGFGFTLVEVDGKFSVATVAPNITYRDQSGQVEKTLLPGDQVLEMGHLKLESLAQPQVMQLMESYPVGKSLRFLVSRGKLRMNTVELCPL